MAASWLLNRMLTLKWRTCRLRGGVAACASSNGRYVVHMCICRIRSRDGLCGILRGSQIGRLIRAFSSTTGRWEREMEESAGAARQ